MRRVTVNQPSRNQTHHGVHGKTGFLVDECGSNLIIGYELAEVKAEPSVNYAYESRMAAQREIQPETKPQPDPDTVTIKRMTEDEARKWINGKWGTIVSMAILRDLNLIREETREEQFTRATGHAVTPAVDAALNWGR